MGAPEVEALDGGGQVYADLSSWWKCLVAGQDAASWLNDLVTNRVDDLERQGSRRTLLLSRTGHVRADFHVLATRDGLLLVQDRVQPRPIRALLEPYVLSSDVEFHDRTSELALLSSPAAGGYEPRMEAWTPSVLGSGLDQLIPAGDVEEWKARNRYRLEATDVDLETWRIRRGIPRFGVDLGEDALPAEAGWDGLVDQSKGCFLGQESVAKVRNLGHPARVITALRADAGVRPGEPVLEDGAEVGRITGVAPDGDGFALLARVRWEAREGSLRTPGQVRLLRRSP